MKMCQENPKVFSLWNELAQWSSLVLNKSLCLFFGFVFHIIFVCVYKKMLYFVNIRIFPLLFQKNSVPLRYENDSEDI